MTSSPDGVKLTTQAGVEWTADYVVGADGARSTLRRLLQIPMEGSKSENSWVIADVTEDGIKPFRPETDVLLPASRSRSPLGVADSLCRWLAS